MTAHGLLRSLTLVSALGTGLVAGVFFAFSTFVMKGLDRTPAPGGLTAMQAINRAAPTPLFMLALFGTALTCTVLGVSAFFRLDEPVARYQLAGCALYLVAIVLTAAYHVPRNDALDAVNPQSVGAAATWTHYVTNWTAWNHVRTVTSLAGAVVLTLATRLT